MSVFMELFNQEKPMLGMVHFPPLPGAPLYDRNGGIKKIRDSALRDAEILVEAGFDGIVFSNEGDRPYPLNVDKITVAAMAALIREITLKVKIPFGLSVISDPEAAISVGKAVEADFVRCFLSWVYAGDGGLISPDPSKLLRLKSNIDGRMKIFANISGHTEPLGGRNIEYIAHGAVKFALADAVILAGVSVGYPVCDQDLINAKKGTGGAPVIAGTGVCEENLEQTLQFCDGVIMGTSIKVDRDMFKPVDRERAKSFIKEANRIRMRQK